MGLFDTAGARRRAVAGLCLGLAVLGSAAAAADLEAVVIGNNAYPAAPLKNAANDAALVAQALTEIGFSVGVHLDVSSDEVPALLEDVAIRFADAEVGLIYYAGHAFQYRGQNQLLAVDVPELSAEVIESRLIPLEALLEASASEGGGRLRLIILDACRNDPFSPVGEGFARGLAFEESGQAETLIAHATGAGRLAFDGPAGGNSPYAIALARALAEPGVTVSDLTRAVRRDVRLATESRQIPWVVGSIEHDYVLNRAAEPVPEVQVAALGDEVPLDQVVWWSLRSEIAPDELRRFVEVFPASAHAGEASERLRGLEVAGAETGRAVVIEGETLEPESVAAVLDLREKVAAEPAYRPQTNVPAELFAIWPEQLPPTPQGLGSLLTECDLVAADPADQQRVAPPVEWGLVNVRRAVRLCGYALAQDPGNPRLAFQLGRALDIGQNFPWARYFYRLAAEAGYSAAMTNLGFMAIEGRGGEIDYPEAAEWYRKAAALGNLRARTNIGEIYVKGQGTEPRPEEAVLWYRLAAGMGWPNAQNALGDLYRRGVGVEQDEAAAAALYRLAAENGQREAMMSLGRSYLNGWGVEKDRQQGRAWLERSVEEGSQYAPYHLARDLIGTGEAASDPERALDLLRLASDRGFDEASLYLAGVYATGEVVERDPGQAYFWARLAELGGLEEAAAVAAEMAAELPAETRAGIDETIEARRRLNGI